MQSLSDSAFYALGYFMFSCYMDNIQDRSKCRSYKVFL